jgi:hypothetical protein
MYPVESQPTISIFRVAVQAKQEARKKQVATKQHINQNDGHQFSKMHADNWGTGNLTIFRTADISVKTCYLDCKYSCGYATRQ